MLQYFIKDKYNSIFFRGQESKVEYICKIDEFSSKIPRAMHLHKDLVEILLVYKGDGIHTIGKEKYKTTKGDLIFYNSNVIHDEIVDYKSLWGTYCVGVSNLKLNDLSLNKIIPNNCCPIIKSGKYFLEILTLFELLEQNVKNKELSSIEYIHCLTKALIIKVYMIINKYKNLKQTEIESLSTKVKKYIDLHYKEDINLEILSNAVKANQYYLAHIFKKETGFSPMQYVAQRRIGEAQNLLISTKWNITQIAAIVGYNDSNYFQKVFHKKVGITPGNYRKYWKK